MESEKRSHSIFPNSVRGLKKPIISPKEIISSSKKNDDNKFVFNSTYSKLSEIFDNNHLSPPNNPSGAQSTQINHLVNHKIIFNPIRNYEDAKFSTKSYGSIITYGVNTYQGLVRNYNEDRVSIILNVIKPPSRKNQEWPKVSFFGIFDGHGGTKCSDFLKENLHHYIFRELSFPSDPIQAITKGFENAEKNFITGIKPKNLLSDFDHSGSCAIVVILVDDNCFVANVGDSRAIYSENRSNQISLLSWDHKPNDTEEKKRVVNAGGYIYQGLMNYQNYGNLPALDLPWRIFPGRLSVSRAFGDIEAKLPELGGNPKVLIATPQIISFKLNEKSDFIVLGSDGIFDKLCNKEILDSVWACSHEDIKSSNIFELSGKVSDMIMRQSMHAGTLDNISCIFICFNNFKQIMQNKFNNINNPTLSNLSMAFNVKNEYSPTRDILLNINFEEVRKRIFCMKEASIIMKKNEFLRLNDFNNQNFEKKPKTSSEAIKNSRFDFIGLPQTHFNEIDFNSGNLNTESNARINNDNDKYLYKIVSKKIKTPVVSYKYESTLPSFKIAQRINKLPKELSIKNLSPTNRILGNHQGNSSANNLQASISINNHNMNNYNNTHYNTGNMNSTSKNANRFLPNISKNVSNTHYNEKNNGGFKFPKQMNLNFNIVNNK